MSLEEIKFHIDEPGEIIDMSIGWLARERLILLKPTKSGYVITDHSGIEHQLINCEHNDYVTADHQ